MQIPDGYRIDDRPANITDLTCPKCGKTGLQMGVYCYETKYGLLEDGIRHNCEEQGNG